MTNDEKAALWDKAKALVVSQRKTMKFISEDFVPERKLKATILDASEFIFEALEELHAAIEGGDESV